MHLSLACVCLRFGAANGRSLFWFAPEKRELRVQSHVQISSHGRFFAALPPIYADISSHNTLIINKGSVYLSPLISLPIDSGGFGASLRSQLN